MNLNFRKLLICFSIMPSFIYANEWSDKAKQDIDEVYTILKENHPGYVDSLNPDFKKDFEKNYITALKNSEKIDSYNGYYFTPKEYITTFRDGHTQLSFSNDLLRPDDDKEIENAGVIIKYRNNKFLVSSLLKNKEKNAKYPEINSEFIACDSISAEELFNENIYKYLGNRNIELVKIAYSRNLFLNYNSPEQKKNKNCVFKNSKGKIEKFNLVWQKTKYSDLKNHFLNASVGAETQFKFEEFAKGKYWISMPSYSEEEKFEKLYAEIEQNTNELRNAALIVFDVRGNTGGDSSFGSSVIKQIWGKEYYNNLPKQQNEYVEWRASWGNYNFVNNQYFKKFSGAEEKKNINRYRYYESLLKNIKAAIANKQDYYLEKYYEEDKEKPKKVKVSNKVKANIVLLTDARCASACLDFADEIYSLPNVKHVGQITGSDTQYMDISITNLKSGLAELIYPMKVYRNRKRKADESYLPQYVYDGDIWETEKLKSWILSLQEENRS
ncbi:S41 family peptidase [Fluviispira vulneris]|uniref:S41 family peptidase n=1 Tax=Fluviispira vulneris TaxID=2763012 RepID=UPI001644E423|nr:S41 family peptidase [Fluviispira vulneris]